MMEHDPLCEPLADYNMHWVPAEQCRICPKIRKIRADERKRAAERLEQAPYPVGGFLKLDVLKLISGGGE